MDRSQAAANCRWAMPTLFLPAPVWLRAWHSPWTCVRDIDPRPLDSTVECATCARWEPRPDDELPLRAQGRPRSPRHVDEL